MALSDDVRAGKGRDDVLNDRVVEALKPGVVGTKPGLLTSWDDLFTFAASLPGVRLRLGHDRLGRTPGIEPLLFEAAVTLNDGADRFDPVAAADPTVDQDVWRRVFVEALLRARGL